MTLRVFQRVFMREQIILSERLEEQILHQHEAKSYKKRKQYMLQNIFV